MKCLSLLLALLIVAGCAKSNGPANAVTLNEVALDPATPAGVAEPTEAERLRLALAADEAVVVDVRSQAEWDAGHLRDAVFLPVTDLRSGDAVIDLPKDKAVYTYCKAGVRAAAAAELLQDQGYTVTPLTMGFEELKAAGLPTEGPEVD